VDAQANLTPPPAGHTVLRNPTVVVDFWDWAAHGGDPEGRKPVILATVQNLFGTKYWNTVAQYYEIGAGGLSYNINNNPGAYLFYWNDDANPIPSPVTDTAIRAEVARVHDLFLLSDETIVLVVTPGQVTNGPGCGYHDHISTHPRLGTPVDPPWVFAAFVYPWEICGESVAAAMSENTVHELSEAVVNPFNGGTTWRQAGVPSDNEIADVCDYAPYLPAELQRRTGSVGPITTMRLWSNDYNWGAGGCVFARSTRDDTFVVDSNFHLEWRGASGGPTDSGRTFSDWGNFGTALGWPSASSWGYNRLDVFARADPDIHHLYTDDGGAHRYWHSYGHPSGYLLTNDPSTISWRPLEVAVFTFGAPSQSGTRVLFRRDWDDGADTGWAALSNAPVQPLYGPTAIAGAYDEPNGTPDTERQDPFYVGVDGNLWHGWALKHAPDPPWDPYYWQWDNWGKPTANLVGPPSVASMQRNHLDVYVRNSQGSISHRWCLNQQCGWADLYAPPSPIAGGVSAVGLGDGRLLVQTPCGNGKIYRNMWQPSGWSGWSASTTTGVSYGGISTSSW
jgi:hypothetical protein